MDNLISAIVFALPGFFAYFWLQSFGINPVVKHTVPEFTAISALLWIPVSTISLLFYNAFSCFISPLYPLHPIWSMTALREYSGTFKFIIPFFVISVFASYIFSALWSKYGFPIQQDMINKIRKWRKLADLADNTSVWDEMFLLFEEGKNKKEMALVIHKLDKPEEFIAGGLDRMSRPFELDRALILKKTDEWTNAYKHYDYPTKRVYVDIKAGVVIKELDHEVDPPLRKKEDKESAETTSSEASSE